MTVVEIFLMVCTPVAFYIGFKLGQWEERHDNIFEQESNQYKNNQ